MTLCDNAKLASPPFPEFKWFSCKWNRLCFITWWKAPILCIFLSLYPRPKKESVPLSKNEHLIDEKVFSAASFHCELLDYYYLGFCSLGENIYVCVYRIHKHSCLRRFRICPLGTGLSVSTITSFDRKDLWNIYTFFTAIIVFTLFYTTSFHLTKPFAFSFQNISLEFTLKEGNA